MEDPQQKHDKEEEIPLYLKGTIEKIIQKKVANRINEEMQKLQEEVEFEIQEIKEQNDAMVQKNIDKLPKTFNQVKKEKIQYAPNLYEANSYIHPYYHESFYRPFVNPQKYAANTLGYQHRFGQAYGYPYNYPYAHPHAGIHPLSYPGFRHPSYGYVPKGELRDPFYYPPGFRHASPTRARRLPIDFDIYAGQLSESYLGLKEHSPKDKIKQPQTPQDKAQAKQTPQKSPPQTAIQLPTPKKLVKLDKENINELIFSIQKKGHSGWISQEDIKEVFYELSIEPNPYSRPIKCSVNPSTNKLSTSEYLKNLKAEFKNQELQEAQIKSFQEKQLMKSFPLSRDNYRMVIATCQMKTDGTWIDIYQIQQAFKELNVEFSSEAQRILGGCTHSKDGTQVKFNQLVINLQRRFENHFNAAPKQEKKEIPLKELSKENVKTFVQALRRKAAGGNITEDEIQDTFKNQGIKYTSQHQSLARSIGIQTKDGIILDKNQFIRSLQTIVDNN